MLPSPAVHPWRSSAFDRLRAKAEIEVHSTPNEGLNVSIFFARQAAAPATENRVGGPPIFADPV